LRNAGFLQKVLHQQLRDRCVLTRMREVQRRTAAGIF
jgi:hypothetical protein